MKYWEVVLREVFLLPPTLLRQSGKDLPSSIGDLAVAADLDPQEVTRILARLDALQAVPVEVAPGDVPGDAILVDVRHADERALAPVPGAVCLQEIDLSDHLPAWRNATLLVFGRDSSQAWSAAMYLRDHGCVRAFTLRDQAQG